MPKGQAYGATGTIAALRVKAIGAWVTESVVVGEQGVGASRMQVAFEAGGLSNWTALFRSLLTGRIIESDLRVETPGSYSHAHESPITGSGGKCVGIDFAGRRDT